MSVYFKTSEEKTPIDPVEISEEIFLNSYKQAVREFVLNFRLTLGVISRSAFQQLPPACFIFKPSTSISRQANSYSVDSQSFSCILFGRNIS